jgi:hypothetical protein
MMRRPRTRRRRSARRDPALDVLAELWGCTTLEAARRLILRTARELKERDESQG